MTADIDVMRAMTGVLPDDFAMLAPHETVGGKARGRCIEAVRIVLPALQRLGVKARPMACDVLVANAVARQQIADGLAVHADGWSIGTLCDKAKGELGAPSLTEPFRKGGGFMGHLVVMGVDWFADLTAEQFSRPQHRIVIEGALIGPVEPDTAGMMLDLRGGAEMSWRWRPEIRSFRTTPAFRQDVPHDLVRALVLATEARIAGRTGDG